MLLNRFTALRLSILSVVVVSGSIALNVSWADEPSVDGISRQILDDNLATEKREELIKVHGDKSAALIGAMAKGLGSDSKEEYRRIPSIWQVAVAAGKRCDDKEMARILDVSMPKAGERLTDWQAVVVGGGIVNGITLAGKWPHEVLRTIVHGDASLNSRVHPLLEAASKMADDESVPTGTRYDALRIIAMSGWEHAGSQLEKYLAKGTHAELQQGGVSGMADVPGPQATASLIKHFAGLETANKEFAVGGLLRSEERQLALLKAVGEKRLPADVLSDAQLSALREAASPKVRDAIRDAYGDKKAVK
jgi:hypothetical protein